MGELVFGVPILDALFIGELVLAALIFGVAQDSYRRYKKLSDQLNDIQKAIRDI